MTARAPVNRTISFSAVDGPGNRTAVFLQGCTFSCKYCHNPETIHACVHCGKCVPVCPTGAIAMDGGRVVYDAKKCVLCDACIKACPNLSCPRIRWMTAGETMQEVRRNVPFVRGVTVSGGECTLHRDYLLELARMIRTEKLDILLDSNGSYDFSEDSELIGAIDGVMLDVKAWNENEHVRLTGMSNGIVLKNLRFLAETGKLTEVRTVAVPDCMNAEETVREVSRLLRALRAENTRYKIIRFRPMGVRPDYRSLRVPADDEMRALEAVAHEAGVRNTVLI